VPYLTAGLRARSIVYGLDSDPGCDVAGRVLVSEAARSQLEVLGVRFWLPYPSPVMARNAVAAMALAQAFGVEPAQAAVRLSALKLEPGRLNIHTLPSFTLIDDSYNSNPASLAAALRTLAAFPGPHTAILGDMLELGRESEVLHLAMGRATRDLEQVFFVGAESRAAAAENPRAHHAATVEALLAGLEQTRLAGAVLVKGSRGMRLERVVQALLSRTTPSEVPA
jgi:UDP-N-acetylmuramoyl-tripeptide--D-alanyl-D-alanine ligase